LNVRRTARAPRHGGDREGEGSHRRHGPRVAPITRLNESACRGKLRDAKELAAAASLQDGAGRTWAENNVAESGERGGGGGGAVKGKGNVIR
jgi:hypothetical protein